MTFSYDVMRRLITKTPDASLSQPAISFTYNAIGQRATMTDASGQTVYSYDGRNRLASKQTPFGTLSYTYDNGGNLATTRSSNANGVSGDYSYDVLNRLSTVTDNRLLSVNDGVTSYNYDDVGNLESYLYPNGVKTSYNYNPLNRLTSMGTAAGATALSHYAYTLGPSGDRTAVTECSSRTEDGRPGAYGFSVKITGNGSTSFGVSASYTRFFEPTQVTRDDVQTIGPSFQSVSQAAYKILSP